jgi:hypothetical protein
MGRRRSETQRPMQRPKTSRNGACDGASSLHGRGKEQSVQRFGAPRGLDRLRPWTRRRVCMNGLADTARLSG